MTESGGQFSEFIGVYNAESTVLGEVSYWIGARLGIRHCSLCDITHGLFTKRADWQECESALQIPFTTTEQTSVVMTQARAATPAR